MRVICIDNKEMTNPRVFKLTEGEVYTASQCPVYPHGYDIAEMPNGKDGTPCCYHKKHFIPLSTIDETEFEREYKKEPQTI